MAPSLVECRLEIGRWTIRINGVYVMDFHRFREGKARQVAMNLADAIERARRSL